MEQGCGMTANLEENFQIVKLPLTDGFQGYILDIVVNFTNKILQKGGPKHVHDQPSKFHDPDDGSFCLYASAVKGPP